MKALELAQLIALAMGKASCEQSEHGHVHRWTVPKETLRRFGVSIPEPVEPNSAQPWPIGLDPSWKRLVRRWDVQSRPDGHDEYRVHFSLDATLDDRLAFLRALEVALHSHGEPT